MRYVRNAAVVTFLALAIAMAGCRKANEATPVAGESAAVDHDSRKPPEFDSTPSGDNADMNQLLAEAMRKGQANLPPGHPPIDSAMPSDHPPVGTTLPAGHPPIDGAATSPAGGNSLPPGHPPIGPSAQPNGPVAFTGDLVQPEKMLNLTPPASWTPKPTRPMTVAIYSLPKPSDAPADAELVISHYPGMKNVPLDMQVQRWAGQFSQPEGQDPGKAVKQSKLENSNHPTTLIDIAGTYRAGSMMGGSSQAQENYRMLTAVIETEQGPWFFKLTGPKETVAAHEKEFVGLVRQAK